MPLTASAVIAGVSAIGKAGVGIGQLLHSKKKPVRPEFEIQDEYFTNRDIAARQAASGLTDKSLDYYSDQAGRGLSTSTNAVLQAGGGVNAIAGVLDSYQQGIRSVAAEDSERQQKNILAYLDRNDVIAKQKTQKWVIDKYEPYKDAAKANAQERAAGMQNLFGGLAEGTAAASQLGVGNLYKDLLKDQDKQQEESEIDFAKPATARTTYYQDKPSSAYGDFVEPYEVTPVDARRAQLAKELNTLDFNPDNTSPDLLEMYKRLFKY